MKDRILKILYLRPKGVMLSLVGLIMLFITGPSFYMIFKFPYYMRLKVIFVFLFVANALLFIRFRDRRKSLFHRMMQSSFFPRKLTFTMEGKFLVFITLGIGFAAVNTGVNLLYLLMAMLLSLIVASGILSELTLRKLRWQVEIPAETIVLSEAVATIRLQNEKRRLSSFSLEGDLIIPEEDGVVQKKGVLLKLGSGDAGQITVRLVFPKRGKRTISGISIGTRFPFSFFSKSRHYKFNRSILVMPRGEEPVEQFLNSFSLGQDEHVENLNKKGKGLEFHSIRQMQTGDDWRNVHWKKTAFLQNFAIKEFEELAGMSATVYLTGKDRGEIDREKREKGIEIAASIARVLVSRQFRVGLVGPNLNIYQETGAASLKKIFVALALLDINQDFHKTEIAGNPAFTNSLISVNLDTLDVSQIGGFPKARHKMPAAIREVS